MDAPAPTIDSRLVRLKFKAGQDDLFTAIVRHPFGENRSDPAPLRVAMLIARAWNRSGSAVIVEGQEGQVIARLNGRDGWAPASNRGRI